MKKTEYEIGYFDGVKNEQALIREICNRCKTERGLARALANHLRPKRTK